MMNRLQFLSSVTGVILFAITSANADSLEWSAKNLPSNVQTIVDGYAKQCKDLGGTLKANAGQPMIMTADLDDDRVQDFVLNPQDMECTAAATAFCGNGGCQIELALSGDDYRKPVDILGGAPKLAQNEEGTALLVWVDGVNCDTDNTKACLATYSWDEGELKTTYQSRASED